MSHETRSVWICVTPEGTVIYIWPIGDVILLSLFLIAELENLLFPNDSGFLAKFQFLLTILSSSLNLVGKSCLNCAN